jgi:hypothetical protein
MERRLGVRDLKGSSDGSFSAAWLAQNQICGAQVGERRAQAVVMSRLLGGSVRCQREVVSPNEMTGEIGEAALMQLQQSSQPEIVCVFEERLGNFSMVLRPIDLASLRFLLGTEDVIRDRKVGIACAKNGMLD